MARSAFLLFLCIVFAPFTVRAAPHGQYYGRGMHTRIVVRDSQTSEPLIGATVTIVSGADTLRGVAKKSMRYYTLQAEYECDRIFRDTVRLEVAYLGYKPFEKRYAGAEFCNYIDAALEADEQQIAQVVVTGKSIAMIFRGDTTVYNASAFKTMADDRLSELLKQLPGVEIRDNKIYADGQEVKRVYVDGRNLFGQKASASLTDLEAADVKNVRIYEEQSPEARHTGDNTAPKQKVMDVETKSRRGVLWGGEVSAMIGASLEEDYSGEHEIRHAGKLRLFRHSEKGSSAVEAANSKDESQRENASLNSKITPAKRTRAEISHEYRRGDTTSVLAYGNFDRIRRSSVGSTLTDYFSTDEYTVRRDESRSASLSKRLSFDVGNLINLQRRKNSFTADWSVSYENGTTSGRNTTDQLLDREQTLTKIVSDGDDHAFSANASLSYSLRLSEKSRLSLRTSFEYADRKSNDWQVDTVASAPGLRMQLHNGGRGGSYTIGAGVNYSYTTGKKSRLQAGYDFSRRYETSRRRAIDFLNDPRGVLDTVNTYDYTYDYYTNRLSVSWMYRSETVSCYAHLWASVYDLARDEFFPAKERAPRRFFSLTPNINLQLGKPKNRVYLFLGASPHAPSAEELRSTLDATNPLRLRAGNPDLKLPMSLSGALRYYNNKAATARTISLGISGGYAFNYVAAKERFFLEETYLPQYDYTAQKGAQLISQVNVDGNYSIGGDFAYSQQIPAIRSTLRLNMNYDFARTPYFYNQTLDHSESHSLHVRLGFESGFSTKVKISLGATTSLSSYRTQQQKRQDLRETVNARLDLRFGKYFGYAGTLYQFYCNSSSKALTRHDVVLNAAAGRKFGKENRFSLCAGAVDILNRPDFASTRFETNYIRTSSTSYLGRYAYLQASYTF